MNNYAQQLIIRVSNGKKCFDIKSQKEITIQKIKKKCLKEFNYIEEDINNIELFYIDEDNDRNLITDSKELMIFAKEEDDEHFIINLEIGINNN